MIECCEQPHLHHAAVFEKYTERRYKEASMLVQAALNAGFTLPHQTAPVRAFPTHAAYHDSSADVQYAHGQLVPIEG